LALEEQTKSGGPAGDVLLHHHPENGQSRSAGERITPECAAVASGFENGGDATGSEHCPDGDAIAQRLGNDQDIWNDPAELIVKERADAPQTALNLIENQQNSAVITDLPQFPEKWR
jgi:hypothetical protein